MNHITASTQAPQRPPAPSNGAITVSLGADGLIVLGGAVWFLWDRLLKNTVVTKLDGVFAPIEEERRLNSILAQVGVASQATRVILTAFHNGSIDNAGYHLNKISTINSYTAPGRLPMTVPIRDLPIGRIMYEVEQLMSLGSEKWGCIEYHDALPQPCKDHLLKNNIHVMYNRMVFIGNLPIGILSLQFDQAERRRPPMREGPAFEILEGLYDQIAAIMRRRIVHPGPLKQLLLRLRPGTTITRK